MMGLPLAFAAAAGAARTDEPAGAVVAAAAHSAAPAPHLFPADAAPLRHRAAVRKRRPAHPGGCAAAAAARRASGDRSRRTLVESADRVLVRQRAADAGDRRRLVRRRDLGQPHAHRRRSDRAGRDQQDAASRSCRCRSPRATSRLKRRARRASDSRRSSRSRTVSTAPSSCRRSRASSAPHPTSRSVWLSDGVDLGRSKEFVDGLAGAVGGRPITVVDGGIEPARALAAAENTASTLSVKVLRVATGGSDNGVIRALDLKGLPLGDARFTFAAGERETTAEFDLPVEIRNDIARLEIAGEHSAGAVQLLDKRWRRRTIGIVSGATADTAQPLLASTYYLSRALGPFADIRLAERVAPGEAVKQFLDQNVPMLILADVGTSPATCAIASRLDRSGRRAGAVRRPAPRRIRRRSGPGEAPARRPHARRLAELGQAAAARRLCAREPVRRHARCQTTSPSPARFSPSRTAGLPSAPGRHWLTARRWSRRAARQRRARAVPRHGRYALVRPAAVGRIRRHAPPHRGSRRLDRRGGRRREHRRARTSESRAADPRARWLRRLRTAPPATAPPGARELHRARNRRSSARLLRTAGRTRWP